MGFGWGIVGFGWVAQDHMAPALAATGHRLVAVTDPDPGARGRAAALGARTYADADALAADPAVEAIYVATPNHLHAEAVAAAARAGKPVLCEKPMAATLAAAEEMSRQVRRAGILYGTAFDQRHHPAHRALREAVMAGRIGRPTAIRILYACWVGPDWAETGRENWRIDPGKAGGGALIDLAPHGLDLVDFLVGEPLVEIRALLQQRVHGYPADDGGVLIGRTDSGILASLHVAYNCPERLPRRRLEIQGAAGLLTAIDTMGQDPGGRVDLQDADGRVAPLHIRDAEISPFRAQAERFAEAVRGGDRSAFSLERDLHTMRLLDLAYRDAARSPNVSAAVAAGP
jgi:1,5-anhydro-D-fructose reductase (1,5-anhydro-D-mannitol-forming)